MRQRVSAKRAWQMLSGAALMVSLTATVALGSGNPSADQVLRRAFDRDVGDKAIAVLEMTIEDGRGGQRVRRMESRSMEVEGATKSLLKFVAPAEMAGTSLLTVDYDDGAREDEQWFFLPSVGRPARIVGSGRAEAFVGSDFSYSDLTRRDPADFKTRMINANADVKGKPCWHLEAVPKTAKVKKDIGYTKLQLFIDKESLVALRTKAEMVDGRTKYVQVDSLNRIEGIWTPSQMVARTVQGRRVLSTTTMARKSVKYGQSSVSEADFSVQRLTSNR